MKWAIEEWFTVEKGIFWGKKLAVNNSAKCGFIHTTLGWPEPGVWPFTGKLENPDEGNDGCGLALSFTSISFIVIVQPSTGAYVCDVMVCMWWFDCTHYGIRKMCEGVRPWACSRATGARRRHTLTCDPARFSLLSISRSMCRRVCVCILEYPATLHIPNIRLRRVTMGRACVLGWSVHTARSRARDTAVAGGSNQHHFTELICVCLLARQHCLARHVRRPCCQSHFTFHFFPCQVSVCTRWTRLHVRLCMIRVTSENRYYVDANVSARVRVQCFGMCFLLAPLFYGWHGHLWSSCPKCSTTWKEESDGKADFRPTHTHARSPSWIATKFVRQTKIARDDKMSSIHKWMSYLWFLWPIIFYKSRVFLSFSITKCLCIYTDAPLYAFWRPCICIIAK